ncbi:MAG: T9SS type A sorting domain-containing protein [bacterium]|nr:T9SS type A sorting domain-containing protein [bacterium]
MQWRAKCCLFKIDNATGIITLCCCSLSRTSSVTGSGTIAYIKWTVVRYGSSKIRLGREGDYSFWTCMLLDTGGNEIEFNMVDGYFSVSQGIAENGSLHQDYLLQAYPNPFGLSTVINYQLPVKSKILLKIYDISGRLVKTLVDETKGAGYYSIDWDTKGNSKWCIFL